MGSTCSPTQPTWEASGLHPLPWVMALPVAKNPERCCRRNDYALAGSRRGEKNCNQILGGKSFFCLLLSRKNPIQYHLGFIGNTVNHGETPIKWCRISDINSRIWRMVYIDGFYVTVLCLEENGHFFVLKIQKLCHDVLPRVAWPEINHSRNSTQHH